MKAVIVGVAVAAGFAAVSAGAQTVATPGERAQQLQARFQIAAMEGVLERAVQLGAQNVRVRVQAVAPDLLFVNGAARARGFWLDGYGVFFDVDVPPMRRSLMWTARMLDQGDRTEDLALQEVKRRVAALSDPAARRDVLDALQQFERERGPVEGGARTAATRVSAQGAPVGTPQAPVLQDPGQIYTSEVKDALISAMINYGTPIPLGPNDYLTVAARDQEGMRLQAADPYEVSTIFLRIKGADLAAYRGGQIDLAEVHKRVEVKEY